MEQYQVRADNSPPTDSIFWNSVPEQDRHEYMRLRNTLRMDSNASLPQERRILSFVHDLMMIQRFINRTPQFSEERCILVGICFAGPFVFINTRVFKQFLGRCKSSVNGSLQQLGYVSLKTKARARDCILSLLPTLNKDPLNFKQWTVRYATDNAYLCFLPMSPIPQIVIQSYQNAQIISSPTPLMHDKQPQPKQLPEYQQILPRPIPPVPIFKPSETPPPPPKPQIAIRPTALKAVPLCNLNSYASWRLERDPFYISSYLDQMLFRDNNRNACKASEESSDDGFKRLIGALE